jgi:hypothetical protein
LALGGGKKRAERRCTAGKMPATRRSRRLSRGAEPGEDPMCTGAGDGSPSEDPEPSDRSHTSRARVTRSSSRSGRTATQYRAAASEPTINTGPKCPVFLLSHELLTLIWTFLDSRTKMTTTVCFPFVFPCCHFEFNGGPAVAVCEPEMATPLLRVPKVEAQVRVAETGSHRWRATNGDTRSPLSLSLSPPCPWHISLAEVCARMARGECRSWRDSTTCGSST